MELELKHLAPYLPYGLKMIFMHPKEEFRKTGVFSNVYNAKNLDDIKIGMEYDNSEHIWMFKPILRPLSDLTKEITHNGEGINPANYIKDTIPNIPNFDYLRSEEHIWKFHSNDLSDSFIEWAVMIKLLEWHFDVFGLIENGLAIDINTLNQ